MGKVKISYDEAVKLGLTKECTECHKVKSVVEFNRQKNGKYGAESKCKECRANYSNQHYQNHKEEKAKYYQSHKEEIANYKKQYYQNNKEEIASQQRQYYQNNKEERINYQKQYYQNNKEELTNYQREYRQNNKEEIASQQRQYRQEHKEELANYKREYYQEHKEELANHKKQYYQNNKEEITNRNKQYRQTPQGKEVARKGRLKHKASKNNSFYQPFTQEDKEFCLNYFNYNCPYTGKQLTNSEIHTDHIVALSDKDGIGATAPWNLIVCDASANMSKHNKPVLEFINSLPNPEEVYNKIRGYIILQAKRYIDIIPEDDITLKTFNIGFEELEEDTK